MNEQPETVIAHTLPIEGLVLRNFGSDADFVGMTATLNASDAADGNDRVATVEEISTNYQHLNNSDVRHDLLLAEVKGEIVGYARIQWDRNEAGEYIYTHFAFLRPEWRRKGIGTAILGWAQGRLRELARDHKEPGPKLFESFTSDTALGTQALLDKAGYKVVRNGFEMVRPDLENIPDFPLPAGLEVRPVLPEHYRTIWEADVEAFRDHWGFAGPNETHYQAFLTNKVTFMPELWKIAWDVEKNEVAGQVKGFINHEENRVHGHLRGYAEFISTRRPWRKRGVARALIALILHEFKARGLKEAALGVDAENPTGAVQVYKDCGFKVTKKFMTYRKEIV